MIHAQWDDAQPPFQRMRRKPLPPFTKVLVPGLAVGSGTLLGLALPSLISADSLADYLKCGVIALTATGTAYGVNRLAIERGALQAAIRAPGAALVSTVSVGAVGAGMFAATYAGFVMSETDRLRLEAFGTEQAAYVDAQARSAREAARIGPALLAVSDDLAATQTCEQTSSCLSGVGTGGKGPVFRAISLTRQRAEGIASQATAGAAAFEAAATRLDNLQAEYRQVVADESLDTDERRIKAHAIVSQIGGVTGGLQETAPTVLAAGYAEELTRGGVHTGSAEANVKLNGLLASHGAQLRSVVSSISHEDLAPPAFPSATGVSDTLSWIGHFLPIAMIVAVVELVFPLTLWLYTYFGLLARLEREDPREPAPKETEARRLPPGRKPREGGARP